MRKTLLFGTLMCLSSLFAQNIKDSSILVSALANANLKQITINWTTTDAQSFHISRKTPSTNEWESNAPFGAIAGNLNTYTDTSVAKGQVYEYRIIKIKDNTIIRAVGYVASGIEIPLLNYKKNILILVDSSTYNGIDINTWKQLKSDYYMDGYGADLLLVSEYNTPPEIKSKLSAWYNSNKSLNMHCLLIGRIPVAYSGLMLAGTVDLPPDAHPDHGGAWPTDLYYAEMDGSWTDVGTMVSGINDVRNKNNPGDGKYDQHFLSDNVDIQIGRIDMSNLPATGLTDIELVKQYLDKLHAFKSGQIKVRNKAFIADNFGYLGGEMPMRSGWNNASAIVGKNNISNIGNFFDSTKTNSYLWTNVMGGGSFTNCSGVGNSTQFKDSIQAVFNVSFGSYFGDWDIKDNFLRSCLASKGLTLTNVWAHRPHWYFHQMAMGMPIGHSVITSQNNLTDFSFASGYVGSYSGNYLDRRISMNLLGDPTLRIKYIAMPSNLFALPQNNSKHVKLSWVASNEAGILGYNVYRTSTPDGIYYPINSSPVSSLVFIDSTPFKGNNYYVVKAVKLETSNCGTYMNSSLGISATATNIDGSNTALNNPNIALLKLYPNPASNKLYIEAFNNETNVQITDINGKLIYHATQGQNTSEISTSNWSKGIYIVLISHQGQQHYEKLVIQ